MNTINMLISAAMLSSSLAWATKEPLLEQQNNDIHHISEESINTEKPSINFVDNNDSSVQELKIKKTNKKTFKPTIKYGIDELLIEGGILPNAPEADSYSTLRTSAYLLWQPNKNWEFRLGGRMDGMLQGGGNNEYNESLLDYGDTYVRYRNGDTRLTLGAQTIVWGRVEAIPLIDRVSRVDLTRFLLDDLPQRRRAQLAARWEQTFNDYKLDVVWLPIFRAAQLPDIASIWSPINRTTGEIMGVTPSQGLATLVGAAQITEDEHGSGGGAIRLTKTGGQFDYGITLSRTRQSLPYYQINLSTPSLTAIYPLNNFVGFDVEFVKGAYTWRSEISYTNNVPFTQQSTIIENTSALDWIGAVEFSPGGKDTRINLQLLAHQLNTNAKTFELSEYYSAQGEIETTFAQGRWKAGTRFFTGINVRDIYISPKISYLGWEPHELYFAAHYFDGEARTMGGFHRDHSLMTFGLKTRF